MNRIRPCIVFAVFMALVFSGCFFPFYFSAYDVHFAYEQNDSSHNVFIQYFVRREDEVTPGTYYTYETVLARDTTSEAIGWVRSPTESEPVDKILIIDTDSRKLLKKLDGDTFLNMLVEEISVETKPFEKITYYKYRFRLTDAFLEGE
jgi:hypothetical protein